MRGANATQGGELLTWSTVGTGRKVLKARQVQDTIRENLKRDGKAAQDSANLELELWSQVLPLQYLHEVFQERFTVYRCPQCSALI